MRNNRSRGGKAKVTSPQSSQSNAEAEGDGPRRPSHVGTVTVMEVLRRLMPNGPQRRGTAIEPRIPDSEWRAPPFWPPDLFCVAATLVEASGCYADPGLILSRNDAERAGKRERAAGAMRIGEDWRTSGVTPVEVSERWFELLAHKRDFVSAPVGDGLRWKRAALELLAFSDEACTRIGFFPPASPRSQPAEVAADAIVAAQDGSDRDLHMPASLCYAVPPDVACVLPKALTPEVGCTLRSLSLNLALLPSTATVGAEWYISTKRPALDPSAPKDEPFNLLLVPFPYEVMGSDFRPDGPSPGGGADGYFGLDQGWLPSKEAWGKVSALIGGLVDEAQLDGDVVHGVVMPETALADGMADRLARDLSRRFSKLELLVCGTLGKQPDGMAANKAVVIRMEDGGPVSTLVQKKHHRWRLTPSQVQQYGLSASLPGAHDRWERIDVSGRRIQFGVNRREAVVAALVCEDLARFDPVLPVVNAVGPNLVVALLMDGPQLQARWPGRYATVLADDPGCSVLTLTSLGMLKRARRPDKAVNRCIALWKDGGGEARELVLPDGAGALLLRLRTELRGQRTLDLRSEDGVVTYRFDGVGDVAFPRAEDLSWLARTSKLI